MNYLNTLIKNIEMSKKIDKNYSSEISRKSQLSYRDINELNKGENVKILGKFKPSYGDDSDLRELRYILSSEKLKKNIVNSNEDTIEVYKNLICGDEIYKFISAENLSLYNPSLIKDVWSRSELSQRPQSIIALRIALNYGIEKDMYNENKKMMQAFDVINNYTQNNIIDVSDNNLIETAEFAIKNDIEKLSYKSIVKLMSESLYEDVFSYLRYISNHGITDIFLDGNSILLPSLTEKVDCSKRKEVLRELECLMREEDFDNLLDAFEYEGFSNKEINTFLYKIKNGEIFDTNISYSITNTYKEIMSFIYPNFDKDCYYRKEELKLYHYALKTGKKKFLKALNEVKESSGALIQIAKEYVYRILSLNNLSVEDIKAIEEMKLNNYSSMLKTLYDNGLRNISFKELKFITSLNYGTFNVYKSLLDIRVDDRIRMVSDLPKIERKTSDEYSLKIADLIREKSLSDRIRDEYKRVEKYGNIKISKDIWLKYFLIEDLDFMKEQIKDELDVLFFVNYVGDIKGYHSKDFEEVKKDIYLNSKIYEDFLSKLSPSEEFLKENEMKIYEFFLTGMMNIFLQYYNSLSDSYRDSLVKITKAELSNKLKDIKFYSGDLAKEIGYKISQEKESLWKNNIKAKGSKYITEETDDYNTIIKLGAIPVDTCMHYNGGSYNYCLLSNFDANKKVVLGKSSDGTILGRAILRLTKISDAKRASSFNGDGELMFRDVETLSNENSSDVSNNEELVLFLERCYTSVNDREEMHFDILKLAYAKAKQLGVRLIVSDGYSTYMSINKFNEDMQATSKSYIYISKSKNGKQYLDSFSGIKGNESVGYVSLIGYKVFLQEGMFNPVFEYKVEE